MWQKGGDDRELWSKPMKRANYLSLIALLLVVSFSAGASAMGGVKVFTGKNLFVVDDDNNVKVVKKVDKDSAYLGIYMDEVTLKVKSESNYPKENGVLVRDVIKDSPADRAGITEGDIIYEFDGKDVEDPGQLARLVRGKKPGDKVKVVIYRDGEKKTLTVKLSSRPWNPSRIDWDEVGRCARDIAAKAGRLGNYASKYIKDIFVFRGKLGIEVQDLNKDLAQYFDLKKPEGVLVVNVLDDSPAAEAGIKAGDVIVAVNGEDVTDADDLIDVLRSLNLEKGDTITFKVIRKGHAKEIKLEVNDENYGELMSPFDRSVRIDISETPHISKGHKIMSIERSKLENEIKTLKKKLKELEKRLDDIERK